MQLVYDSFSFLNQLNTLVKNNIPIVSALSILANLNGESTYECKTKNIALHFLENIQKGYSFTTSLFLCSQLNLSNNSAKLLQAAEQSACIKEVLDFICLQHEQKIKTHKDIQNIIAYPILIVLLTIFGTALLIHYRDLFLTNLSLDNIFKIVAQAIVILMMLLCILAMYVYFSFKENTGYTLFYSLGFLQQSGFTFSKSLELCLECNSKNAALYCAYRKISKGEEISRAFREAKLADDKNALLLELSEQSGTVGLACSQIAHILLTKYEERKRRCIQLLEPLLLLIVGVYLIILMNGIVVPYISDFGGVL